MGYRTCSSVVSDLRSETKGSRFTSMCRDELSAVIARLSSGWKLLSQGFPHVENMGGRGGPKSIHGGAWGFKMLLKIPVKEFI